MYKIDRREEGVGGRPDGGPKIVYYDGPHFRNFYQIDYQLQ